MFFCCVDDDVRTRRVAERKRRLLEAAAKRKKEKAAEERKRAEIERQQKIEERQRKENIVKHQVRVERIFAPRGVSFVFENSILSGFTRQLCKLQKHLVTMLFARKGSRRGGSLLLLPGNL